VRVLVVCTGNICRSPVIEAVLRERIPGLELSSAGTRAEAGRPLHPLTADAMTGLGLEVPLHRSRVLGPEVVRDVELVVTAERAHRAPVLALRPDLLRLTFTFAELVDLAEAAEAGLPPGGELAALRAVVAQRGRHAVSAQDLPDPVTGTPAEHTRMVSTVVSGAGRLRAALVAGTGPLTLA
jgi:protein-tyrosine phosphatase